MADQSRKSRSELKSYFVPNAIPTANDYAALIDSAVNQLDDGVRIEAGKLTVSGAIEAKAGLEVTGAPVTIGAEENKQSLTIKGTLTASDLVIAENGFTVSSGTVLVNTSATIAGQLVVGGQVNANANVAITGNLTAVGGPVTIGDAGTNLPMTIHHTFTANREVTLNKGLTVKGASVSIGDAGAPQSLSVSGTSNLQGGATILNGLSVPTGTVAFGGAVAANGGLWVKGGALNVGEPSAKQDVNINGVLYAQDSVNLYKGLNTHGQAVSVNAGLNVWGGNMIVGSPSANQTLTVNGTVTISGTSQAKTFQLAAPPGDPSPILTARAVPANQGGSNESTELIIFHGDDFTGSGYGPDYITLRAPAIRLQTYASVGTPSIDNVSTSNTRFHIDSYGAMMASGTLTVSGLVTANAGLTVASGNTTLNGGLSVAQVPRTGSHLGAVRGAYITGDFDDAGGIEFRHTNGTQGIGFGNNTIYATGSDANQVLRLKARGAGYVDVAGNLNVTGILTGPPNDYLKAQFTLTGGGVVRWSGGRLKWSNRFLVVSAGKSAATFVAGYANIVMPTADVPAANVYDGQPRSVNGDGILLKAWEALYAVHAVGQNHEAVTLRIVHHDTAHQVQSHWILIAVMNADENSVKLGNGQTIQDGNRVTFSGPVDASALVTANAGLTVGGLATVNGALSIAQAPRSGSHPPVLGAYITGEFGEALGVEIRHSNGTQGIGFGYNTIYAAGSSANQPLRLKARGADSVEVLGNLYISGNLTGPAHDYLRAQFSLSGGGTVTWSGGRLKWTNRLIAISMGITPTISDGHLNIFMPTSDIPAGNVYNGVARSANASGIQLNPWEALYAVHTTGQISNAIQFRIVVYNVPHTLPANWLLLAVVNNDDGGTLKLGTGQIIHDGGKVNVTGPLTVGGVINANAGLTVTGGQATIGTPAVNQSLVVNGSAQANTYTFPALPGDRAPSITARAIPANQGPQGSSNEATELILFHSNDASGSHAGPDCITLRAPELRLQTYADHTVSDVNNPAGANTRLLIDSVGAITAFAGLTVSNGPLWSNGLVTANAGLNVTNGPLNVGPLGGNPSLIVNGTAMVNTLTFPAPPGDPLPVITARAIPTNQGGSHEATELILFHSNDGSNGAGPDSITLRAPGLRFQTYNDPNVTDIGNPAGSQTRIFIEPTGPVNMYHGLVRLGTQPGLGAGQVTSAIGFMAPGVSHGQLAYRAGIGFELVDVSANGPLLSYGRDQLPYADLRLRQIQFQSQAVFSSRTLKENIRNLSEQEALDAFQKLQPVTFRFKTDATGRTHAGFIAEDVPDLVSMDEHKAISPTDILAVLTRIVHVQQEAIQRLEAQIAALNPG